MTIPTTCYWPTIEEEIYKAWKKTGCMTSKTFSKKPYTIILPPPNVTGQLHLGHVLSYVFQDILIRKKRMEGEEVCWVPGIDHASIATEAKVWEWLSEKGISKKMLNKADFFQYAGKWKKKYSNIILQQMEKIGLSCNWERSYFTLDSNHSESVTEAFIALHKEGLIYRDWRMIHWDPKRKTALSDDEVIYKKVSGKLYHIAYSLSDKKGKIVVATTRPETLFGDTAICVNPEDQRYQSLIGKQALLPFVGRCIPIIADPYVDMKLGTGCLKVTPAHDPNDYLLAKKHNLELIEIMDSDGFLNKKAIHFSGLERFEARKKVVEALRKLGVLVKEEEYPHKIGFSERTFCVVEPRLSKQWFLRMKGLAEPALEAIKSQAITFFPKHFTKIYGKWLNNIKDWCLSRQLWWGHSIPVYYLPNGHYIVANNKEQALQKAQIDFPEERFQMKDLEPEKDVLDTWFSSAILPISLFDSIVPRQKSNIFPSLPTSILVTGADIIFFWVARMIMMSYFFTKNREKSLPPFRKVYFTGLVRDKAGQKMSKSLGNSPDILQLITKYGADGLRAGVLFSSPAGRDLLFEERLCHQGSRFVRKLWNSFRLIASWKKIERDPTSLENTAIAWCKSSLYSHMIEWEKLFKEYHISKVFVSIYRWTWNIFCPHFLEMIKIDVQKGIAHSVQYEVENLFSLLLQWIHPFMPFVTEKIWQSLGNQKTFLMQKNWYKVDPSQINCELINDVNWLLKLLSSIRQIRKREGWKTEPLYWKQDIFPTSVRSLLPYFKKYGKILFGENKIKDYKKFSFVYEKEVCTLWTPISSIDSIDSSKNSKQKTRLLGLLKKVQERLNHPPFLENAPLTFIEKERKKEKDILEKLSKWYKLDE